jgi:hypothetical protein
MTRYSWVAGLAAFLVLPVLVQAADASRFTLGKAVPSDVYICIQGVRNPQQEYIQKYWETVGKAFMESGVVEDVHNLIGTFAPEADRARFEAFWSKAGELIRGVDWHARVEEGVYAGRMGAPMSEFLLLLRYEEGKAAKNAEAFAAVLKEINAAAGPDSGVAFQTSTSHGATVSTLSLKDASFINLRVAVRGPVVALALDRTLLDEALAALDGKPVKTALVDTPRYKEAIAKLPPPENAVVFVDIRAIIEGVRGILHSAASQAAGDQNGQEAARVVGKVLDEFSMFDYVAATARTEGLKEISDSVLSLSPDAEKSRLFKVFRPDPVEKFDRFVPKEATGYSVSSGVDLSALYAAVLDFISKEAVGGEKLLERWDQVQNEIGFRPDRDVFSWLGGQMITVTLPAVTPTPFSTKDSVTFIQLRDEKKAAEKIQAGLDRLNDFLTGRGTPLTSQPAEVEGANGFRMVTHPVIMMFFRPVYGISNGYLVIGTSSKAIEECLATARGEHPSVVQNERVQREALIPKGPVASASFKDLSTLGTDIAQVFNAMGFISAVMPNQPETKPIRGIIGILGKLGPVAEKIDFIRSSSSVATFDGRAWRCKTVTNYRSPTTETAPVSK